MTPADVLALTDRIKARGSEQAALLIRNILKRLYAYAIARQVVDTNPAAAIQARYIAQSKTRDRVLSKDEIAQVMRTVYRSSMRTANKLALHMLLLTMVRKTELTEARWEHVDMKRGEWHIPEPKNGKPHIVYLSEQAKALFEEMRAMAGDSPFCVAEPFQSPQAHRSEHAQPRTRGAGYRDGSGFL